MFSRKSAFAAVLCAAFLTAPAGAQDRDAGWVEVDDDVVVSPFGETADVVDDWDVYDVDGNRIGEVEEVIGPTRDTATALVIEFEGGEYRGDDLIIPLEEVDWVDGRLVLNIDPSELAAKERYDD